MLEVETDFAAKCARCDVVRPAESGEEVVERVIICQIDDSEASAPFVTVSVEEIVLAQGKIEQAPLCDAGRSVVVVFSVRLGHRNESGSKLRCRAFDDSSNFTQAGGDEGSRWIGRGRRGGMR